MFARLSVLLTLAVSVAAATAAKKPAQNTLKGAAGSRYFATALGLGHLTNASDPEFATLARDQFSGATPENEMKWENVEPQRNVFNFTGGEAIAAFAAQNNMVLRGHTLVWHSQLAPWVSSLTGGDLEAAMKNHIVMTMTQFRGRIYAWDVVNEAFNDDGTFRSSPFYNQLGQSFIETAFRTARSVNDKAKLYINDYNIEGINNKSTALYKVVKDLKKKGLIDGVGLQSHFIVGELPPDIQQNMQRFTALGLDVAVTELDIRANTPVNASTIAQHAKDYASVVNACKAVKRCVGITNWGITDLYSWIPATFPGQGYGLLWDDNYKEKPAFKAVLKALAA